MTEVSFLNTFLIYTIRTTKGREDDSSVSKHCFLYLHKTQFCLYNILLLHYFNILQAMAKDYHIKLHSRYFGGEIKVAHHSSGQLQTLCFFSWSGYSISFLQALLFLTIFSTRPSPHPYSIAHTLSQKYICRVCVSYGALSPSAVTPWHGWPPPPIMHCFVLSP